MYRCRMCSHVHKVSSCGEKMQCTGAECVHKFTKLVPVEKKHHELKNVFVNNWNVSMQM